MKWYKDLLIRVLQLGKVSVNIITQVTDFYLRKKLQDSIIRNDRGASFTDLERRGHLIVKHAQERGEIKLLDEMDWYLAHRDEKIGRYFPAIHSYSRESGKVFYEMTYYDYPNLRTIIISDMNAFFFLKIRWKRLLDLLLGQLFVEANSAEPGSDYVERNHLSKLRDRVAAMVNDAPFLEHVVNATTLLLNGKRLIGWKPIIDAIAGDQSIMARLTPPRVYVSHGDLHCNNILCGITAERLVLIDCRGRAPDGTLFFDPAYDIAKLFHDLHSQYSLIEKHFFSSFLYTTEEGDVAVEFEFTQPIYMERFLRNYDYVRQQVQERFTGFGDILYRADFTEAVLYLTMVPFHLKFKAEGLVCFVTGLLRLNEWLQANHRDLYDSILEGL